MQEPVLTCGLYFHESSFSSSKNMEDFQNSWEANACVDLAGVDE